MINHRPGSAEPLDVATLARLINDTQRQFLALYDAGSEALQKARGFRANCHPEDYRVAVFGLHSLRLVTITRRGVVRTGLGERVARCAATLPLEIPITHARATG